MDFRNLGRKTKSALSRLCCNSQHSTGCVRNRCSKTRSRWPRRESERRLQMTDTVSLVPRYEDNDVYLVLDELVTFGRVWRELSEEAANEQTVLELIANGEFHRPMRVIVFNTAQGWSRDDTVDVGL